MGKLITFLVRQPWWFFVLVIVARFFVPGYQASGYPPEQDLMKAILSPPFLVFTLWWLVGTVGGGILLRFSKRERRCLWPGRATLGYMALVVLLGLVWPLRPLAKISPNPIFYIGLAMQMKSDTERVPHLEAKLQDTSVSDDHKLTIAKILYSRTGKTYEYELSSGERLRYAPTAEDQKKREVEHSFHAAFGSLWKRILLLVIYFSLLSVVAWLIVKRIPIRT